MSPYLPTTLSTSAVATHAGYRADIDGLRGVAILTVVLFHAWPSLLPGGYVGVDVFFVISGYLITRLIWPEIAAGQFSFLAFYERRVRRLAPAALTVFAVVAGAAWFLLPPSLTYALSKALMNAVIFAANLYQMDLTGYFAPANDTAPLTHVWSLAVEEQFYVVFPPLLLLLARYAQRRVPLIIAVLSIGSLLLAGVLTLAPFADASRAYFNPLARFWELMLGALLVFTPPPRSELMRQGAAVLGLAAIVASACLLGAESGFPGPAALPATLGAAALLFAGAGERPSAVGVVLASPLCAGLGLISYSLYLWHWPLLAYARVTADGGLTSVGTAVAVALAVLAAIVSYRWIEQPVRRQRDLFTRPRLFVGFAVLSGVLLSLSVAGQMTRGFQDRLDKDTLATLRVAASNIWKGPGSTLSNWAPVPLGPQRAEPEFILVGNSHAQVLAPMLEQLATARGVSGQMFATIRCNFTSLPRGAARPGFVTPACEKILNALDDFLTTLQSRPRLVLSSQLLLWWEYVRDAKLDPAVELERMVTEWRRRGFPVTILAPVPAPGINVLLAYERTRFQRRAFDGVIPYARYLAEHHEILTALERLADRTGVEVLYPHTVLCDSASCRLSVQGKPAFFDFNHLSSYGVEELRPMLDGLLRRVQSERR